MKPEIYFEVQARIASLAAIVADMPLNEFIEAAESADAIGPIVDPTLWRKGHDKLSKIVKFARLLRNFQSAVLAEQVANENKRQP